MSIRLLEGDAIVRLSELEAGSIDACVTDPPYGLKFMGKAWDHGVPGEAYWSEVLRVLKPNANLVAFGGTRTHHRLTCAIEDAGFEIRDCLMWLHGQGFPKGKGQLKPAWEPIVLARKAAPAPWLNVDGCRIAGPKSQRGERITALGRMNDDAWQPKATTADDASGRWPANCVLSHSDGCVEVGTKRVKGTGLGAFNRTKRTAPAYEFNGADADWNPNAHQAPNTYADADGTEAVAAWSCDPECAVRMLDEQSGDLSAGAHPIRRSGLGYGGGNGTVAEYSIRMDAGGASRFFYCSKASAAERRPYNDHPTVKPLALMRWIVKLVTPPGGTILDPFCGSGSTLVAADREGFDCVGIDSDPHAIEIARRRVTEDARLFAEVV